MSWLKKNDFDAQAKLEELMSEGHIHNIAAVRILLIANTLKEGGAFVVVTSELVREELVKKTSRHLPAFWFDRALETLAEHGLLKHQENNTLDTTSNGAEVARVALRHTNKQLLDVIWPNCPRVKFMQDTALHFARAVL